MRAIVTGGRDFNNREAVFKALKHFDLTCLVHGGARGADTLAGEHASEAGVNEIVYEANWKEEGKFAGPLRNRRMLVENKDAIVIAFPGGRGTANCILQAKEMGREVYTFNHSGVLVSGGDSGGSIKTSSQDSEIKE